jgi:hypothetical protein
MWVLPVRIYLHEYRPILTRRPFSASVYRPSSHQSGWAAKPKVTSPSTWDAKVPIHTVGWVLNEAVEIALSHHHCLVNCNESLTAKHHSEAPRVMAGRLPGHDLHARGLGLSGPRRTLMRPKRMAARDSGRPPSHFDAIVPHRILCRAGTTRGHNVHRSSDATCGRW